MVKIPAALSNIEYGMYKCWNMQAVRVRKFYGYVRTKTAATTMTTNAAGFSFRRWSINKTNKDLRMEMEDTFSDAKKLEMHYVISLARLKIFVK